MLIAGLRFICRRLRAAGGARAHPRQRPGRPGGRVLVRSFPLGAVRVLVLVVAVYTALAMLRAAANDARLARVIPALSDAGREGS